MMSRNTFLILLGINYLVAIGITIWVVRAKYLPVRKKIFLIIPTWILPFFGPLLAMGLSNTYRPGFVPGPRKEFDIGGSAHAMNPFEKNRDSESPNRKTRRFKKNR